MTKPNPNKPDCKLPIEKKPTVRTRRTVAKPKKKRRNRLEK